VEAVDVAHGEEYFEAEIRSKEEQDTYLPTYIPTYLPTFTLSTIP
jgi:hypothetical protein